MGHFLIGREIPVFLLPVLPLQLTEADGTLAPGESNQSNNKALHLKTPTNPKSQHGLQPQADATMRHSYYSQSPPSMNCE